jgi:hypothetical protein
MSNPTNIHHHDSASAESEARLLMAGHRAEAQRVITIALEQGMDRLEALRLARGSLKAASRAQVIGRAERAWQAAEAERFVGSAGRQNEVADPLAA